MSITHTTNNIFLVFFQQPYVTLLAMALLFIPAIIIGACYSVIVIIIWRKGTEKNITQTRRFARKNGENSGSTLQLLKKDECS